MATIKTVQVISTVLLVAISISCSKEPLKPLAKEVPSENSANVSVLFEESEAVRFRDDEKKLISAIIVRSEREVRKLLPTLPEEIEISVAQIDRDIDVVGGVTGRANAPGIVLIQLSSVFPEGIAAAAETALSSAVFHELHHLDRGWTIEGNKFGAGIPIAAVNEGLASVFADEYTDEYFDEAYGYPAEVEEWLEEILALPEDASYSDWVGGEHPDGRNAIGYRVGRYIIHQASAKSGFDVLQLSKLSPAAILEFVAGS